jgi:hypothetical protein
MLLHILSTMSKSQHIYEHPVFFIPIIPVVSLRPPVRRFCLEIVTDLEMGKVVPGPKVFSRRDREQKRLISLMCKRTTASGVRNRKVMRSVIFPFYL